MTLTSQLGAFASSLRYKDLPASVGDRCRSSLLDAVGIMIGAVDFATRNGDRRLLNYLDAMATPGGATALGYGLRTTPLMAAFANGTLMEALDFQDTNLGLFAHSGTSVIPAILAVGETTAVTWGELLPAIAAGYEIHSRLLLAVQPAHNERGFLATGTFGTCGAAAAAGRALGLDSEAMSAALGIAGFLLPISNQDNQFKGHSAKPVHGGQAAMTGLSSAQLAKSGYRAGLLEGEPPRMQAALTLLGDGKPNLDRALHKLGEQWHLLDTSYKPYPIGHLIVGIVEIILALLAERPVQVEDIEYIEIATFRQAWMLTGQKYTSVESNYVDAHLSVAYCVAATLLDGEMTTRQLDLDRLRDPRVHQLASLVRVRPDEGMTALFPQTWPATVVIRFRNGESRERSVDHVKWSPARTPSWSELGQKFHSLVDPLLGERRATDAIEIVAGLNEKSTLGALMAAVT